MILLGALLLPAFYLSLLLTHEWAFESPALTPRWIRGFTAPPAWLRVVGWCVAVATFALVARRGDRSTRAFSAICSLGAIVYLTVFARLWETGTASQLASELSATLADRSGGVPWWGALAMTFALTSYLWQRQVWGLLAIQDDSPKQGEAPSTTPGNEAGAPPAKLRAVGEGVSLVTLVLAVATVLGYATGGAFPWPS